MYILLPMDIEDVQEASLVKLEDVKVCPKCGSDDLIIKECEK